MAVAVMEQETRAGSLAPAVKARMEAFVAQVAGAAMNHSVQRSNAEVYVRGLLAAGARKSLEPLVGRLDGDGDYQSLQQFLADSPWDSGRLMQAVAERVAPVVGAEACLGGMRPRSSARRLRIEGAEPNDPAVCDRFDPAA